MSQVPLCETLPVLSSLFFTLVTGPRRSLSLKFFSELRAFRKAEKNGEARVRASTPNPKRSTATPKLSGCALP